MRLLPLFFLQFLIPALAWATGLQDRVVQAAKLLAAGELVGAVVALDEAESEAAEATSLPSQRDLARIPYYRGLVRLLAAGVDDRVLDAWRAAFVIDPEFPWEEHLIQNDDAWSAFEAVRAEVRSWQTVAIDGSWGIERSILHIDGRVATELEAVIPGRHLVHVRCGDGILHGAWLELPPKKAALPHVCGKKPAVVPTSASRQKFSSADSEGAETLLPRLAVSTSIGMPSMASLDFGFGRTRGLRMGLSGAFYSLRIVGGLAEVRWIPSTIHLGPEIGVGLGGYITVQGLTDDVYPILEAGVRYEVFRWGFHARVGLTRIGIESGWWIPLVSAGFRVP